MIILSRHRSSQAHLFSQVPSADIPRSSFNRSHGHKTTFDAGFLVPFYIDEVLPGDTFNCRAHLFARLATPIVPMMDNMYLETFYFAVPIRLLWNNWERFNGAQDDPGDSTDFLIPEIVPPAGGWQAETLSDYFGLPTKVSGLTGICSFWHRAYNLIWNEWFRDQNLQESLIVPKDDGPDNDDWFKLMRRGKRHDYFTSALPWPQKGPGVEIPIGSMAPISGTITTSLLGNNSDIMFRAAASGVSSKAQVVNTAPYPINFATAPSSGLNYLRFGTAAGQVGIDATSTFDLQADLSAASAVTINSLRQAFQLQKMFERDARGGTRYTEIVRSHFGVVSPDARLQRPEFLGGSSHRVIVNPVAQTNSTDATSPQGNLAAFGLVSDSSGGFVKSFVEHCVIIGLVNVRADLTYQQGIPRMFSRRTRYDFYWPSFAHLGEQAVLNKEIYAQGTAEDDEVFGYQERWAEYRYFPSQITGKFRSNFDQPLDLWHLAQYFENKPTLSSEFIEENPPVERVIAVPSEPHFIMDSDIKLSCARPMPVYSVPGYIDHF